MDTHMKFQSWWHSNEKLYAVLAVLVLSHLICIKINSPPQWLKQSWRSAIDYIFLFFFFIRFIIFFYLSHANAKCVILYRQTKLAF